MDEDYNTELSFLYCQYLTLSLYDWPLQNILNIQFIFKIHIQLCLI